MRRRGANEEIQLLSTSFLDLLCCGLCSVVLLWVLAGSGQKARPDEPFGYVQVGQTGNWHWRTVELWSPEGKRKYLDINRSLGPAELAKECTAAKSQLGLTVFVRKGSVGANDFAGLLMLAADRNTTDLEARVVFADECDVDNDLHVIQVTGQSGPQRIEDAVVYLPGGSLQKARSSDAQLESRYQKHVRGAVPHQAGRELTLSFRVRGGRIAYTPPAAVK